MIKTENPEVDASIVPMDLQQVSKPNDEIQIKSEVFPV